MSLYRPPSLGAFTSTSRTVGMSALFLALCGVVASADAQPAGPRGPGGPGGPEGSNWGVGLAVVNAQKPYKGMDRETKALPMISFENEYVKIGALGLEAKLPSLELGESDRINFSILGKMELGGYEADDAPILAGMADRKGGFWAGAKAEWENDVVEVNAQWLADTSGKSNGQRFSLGLEKKLPLGRVMLVPHVTAHWLDKKNVNYYYGVRADEAIEGRAFYAGKAGVNLEAGLRAMYHIDQSQGILFDASVTGLAKSIKDSPIVDRSSSNRVLLAYMYRF